VATTTGRQEKPPRIEPVTVRSWPDRGTGGKRQRSHDLGNGSFALVREDLSAIGSKRYQKTRRGGLRYR
jgi:hypothetical protein